MQDQTNPPAIIESERNPWDGPCPPVPAERPLPVSVAWDTEAAGCGPQPPACVDYVNGSRPGVASAAEQLKRITAYAHRSSRALLTIYDDSRSAAPAFPRFEAMMKAADLGKINAIVVSDVGCLPYDYQVLYKQFAALETPLDLYLPTRLRMGEGEALLSSTCRQRRSARIRAGQLEARRQGRTNGAARFGYHRDPRRAGVDHIDPKTASAVRFMFECSAQGWLPSETARILNQKYDFAPRRRRGTKKSRGRNEWTSSDVWAIVRNPLYMGVIVYERGSRSQRNIDELRARGVCYENERLAIVSEELWDKANLAVRNRRR